MEKKNENGCGVDVIDAMGNEGNEEESWSDEEGEDPKYSYNYLRRRRYFLHP